jgi:peptidoglycan/xylan/chitin deacetylase (PgdA/CDA1 family)
MGGAWADPKLRPVPPSRAVWGRHGRTQLGLPLIADILAEHGLAATFFLDAFIAEQGYPGESEPICQYLLGRGHDVQLHVHPNGRNYRLHLEGKPFQFTDHLADLGPAVQRELIAEGSDRIARWTGRAPVAFRAGNMSVSDETLGQLACLGIPIDSSYTFPYAGTRCRLSAEGPYNGSKWYGRVLELALSGFTQRRLPALKAAKPLDLMGISFAECRDAVRKITAAGADAVLILHCFSLFKVRNVQYEGGRLDRIVTGRFRRLCRWLAENAPDYPTRTFADVAAALAEGRYQARAAPPCKLNAGLRALARKAVQVYNRLYWT